jgi:subfamily B ATP-binding cassette protein MsbA
MNDRQQPAKKQSYLQAVSAQLRGLLANCNELLLGKRRSFSILALIALMGTIAEGAGIALIMPLMAAIQGQEVTIPSWLDSFSHLEVGNPVVAMAALVAAAFLVKNALVLVRLRWSLILTFGLWQRWVGRIVDNLLYAAVDPGSTKKSGTLVSTTLVETRHAVRVLQNLLELLVSFFTFCCIYTVLWLASWRVTLVLTVFILILLLLGLRPLTRTSHAAGVRAVRSLGSASNFLLEILGGITYVKSFNREGYFGTQMGEELDDVRRAFIKMRWLANFVAPLIETLFVVIFCLAIIFSAGFGDTYLNQYLPLIGLFSAAAFRLFPVLSGIGQHWVFVVSKQPSIRRVLEYMRFRPRESGGSRPFKGLQKSIAFREVDHIYAGRQPALSELSVELERGKRLVLAGESGSGKSTAVSMLLGFIKPEAGEIRIDGEKLEDFDLSSWRRAIGYVGQEGYLFHTTIAENITLGRIPDDDPRIEEAGRIVGLDEFVATLPEGYATVVGERGTQLSGGQRQRIAIARAILMRPEILVLDEAMSALDNESASRVTQALNDYLPTSTWLVVAHRLGASVGLDPMILVLRNGRVIERGSHQELMDAGGYYYQLFEAEALSNSAPSSEN